MGFFSKLFVYLLFRRSGGVNFLQLGNGEGRLFRIFSGKVGIEIRQLRLACMKLRNDQTHLQAPVAQMNVANGIVAKEFVQPLQALADDGGAQMTDVQGLGNVGTAVVHHDGLACSFLGDAEILSGAHFFQIIPQEGVGQLQIDKAGHYCLHQRVILHVQLLHHCLGDFDGSALILLGCGQRAVALILAQVGAVGNRHPSEGCVVSGIHKRLLHFGSDNVKNFFHNYAFSLFSAIQAR